MDDGLVKLNIGSRKKAPGWTTFDAKPGPGVDLVGDCRDLSRFEDGSIDVIYASHVLEHISYQNELDATLREWWRVLMPGGEVMISVPDFEVLCRLFLRPGLQLDHRFHVMRMAFGSQLDPHNFHCVGLTFEFLEAFLKNAGYRDIRRVEALGIFQDTSTLTVFGTPVSLNVRARKPLPKSGS